jgi:hypothetical protein
MGPAYIIYVYAVFLHGGLTSPPLYYVGKGVGKVQTVVPVIASAYLLTTSAVVF